MNVSILTNTNMFLKALVTVITFCSFSLPASPNTILNVCPKKVETTFAFIKPDAVAAGHSGMIISLIERNKFKITRMHKFMLTKNQAEQFYAEHKGKPFFPTLITYMTSGPVIALALQKEDAVTEWRTFMGATNPEKSAVGTLRRMFGKDMTYNAVHGSDSFANAQRELKTFFPAIAL